MTKLDQAALRRHRNQAAATLPEAAELEQRVGEELLQRLDYVDVSPKTILYLGSGSGCLWTPLRKTYRAAKIVLQESAFQLLKLPFNKKAWWRKKPLTVCGDLEHLPFQNDTQELIIANLSFDFSNALAHTLQECHRLLKPGGLLMFTMLGPDTLIELKAASAAVDDFPRVHPFLDMHDIGDAVVKSGFQNPVFDVDYYELTYASTSQLWMDLRHLGVQNVHKARQTTLTGRDRWARLEQAYECHRDETGLLPVTAEVVFGHAWAGAPLAARKNHSSEEYTIPLQQIRRR